MKFKSSDTLAGNLWFSVIHPVDEGLEFSPTPINTLHLIVDLVDDKDALQRSIPFILPYGQKKEYPDAKNMVTSIDDEELDKLTTVKELNGYLDDYLGTIKSTVEDEEFFFFAIELVEKLQTAYLRIKSKPTAKTLRSFTRNCFKAISSAFKLVIYIVTPDNDEIRNTELMAGWAFVDYLDEEVLQE